MDTIISKELIHPVFVILVPPYSPSVNHPGLSSLNRLICGGGISHPQVWSKCLSSLNASPPWWEKKRYPTIFSLTFSPALPPHPPPALSHSHWLPPSFCVSVCMFFFFCWQPRDYAIHGRASGDWQGRLEVESLCSCRRKVWEQLGILLFLLSVQRLETDWKKNGIEKVKTLDSVKIMVILYMDVDWYS